MAKLDTHSDHQAPGDREVFTGADTGRELSTTNEHTLDSQKSRELLSRLLSWYFAEREKQSANRLEMAIDADFYDNIQWNPEDQAEVESRGQMALVYNEVAPMVDWLIGTERRQRADWKVLPRTEDDVQAADIKTKVLKYVSDVNRVVFNRSQAFSQAVKAGIGWLDDGVRDDPTQDVIYSKSEDWRNVLWDSSGYDLALSDSRYLFRWRWVDEDIAVMMFPDRAEAIRRAAQDSAYTNDSTWDEDAWRTGGSSGSRSGQLYAAGTGIATDQERRRIKLIECQFREPVKTKIVGSGPLKGAFFDERDGALVNALRVRGGTIVDKMMMRMHVAVFTEASLLSVGPSIFRHNSFSLTPVWCYRRDSDRLPYGAIRRVRGVQQDLNKRASKALFMLNTNQIIADDDATDDWEKLRDEADRPDGVITKKPGSDLQIRRDTDAATGQIQMMTLAGQSIQKSAGVAQENMGRQTNAVSGEAIKARQIQGSVVTTEPFDNLRLATQVQGEKQLSIAEQFYTEEKVIRLTGTRGALDWVRINQPEQQPDGSVRYLNDITESMADFVVQEQDYAGTLRAVMFEGLNNLATRLPPEIALRIMTVALEFSDFPNKDEIAEQFRKITGERDPNKEMTPEEMQQQEQQLAQQSEALQMQRETAMQALEEQRAKVRHINAQASKLESESGGAGAMPPEMEQAMRRVQEQAATQIDALSQQLAKAQSDLANRTIALNREADNKLELARIDADARIRVAEIQKVSDKVIARLQEQIQKISEAMGERSDKAKGEAAESEAKTGGSKATPAGLVLNITGNVDVKSEGVQIEAGQGVNVSSKDATVQAQEANITAPGGTPVSVAGDLKADQTNVTMQMPEPKAVSKQVLVQRDKGGRITGAEIKPTTNGDSK